MSFICGECASFPCLKVVYDPKLSPDQNRDRMSTPSILPSDEMRVCGGEDFQPRPEVVEKWTHDKYGDYVMLRYKFKTLQDTDEILFYGDGIWIPGAEKLIHAVLTELSPRISAHTLNEVLNYLRARTYATREVFDSNPYLLCLGNCVLNLETQNSEGFNHHHNLTVKVPVAYDPAADCPEFMKFISEVLDPSDIPVIQELFGYCLYRKYHIQKAFLFVGTGANGKSTLISVLKSFLSLINSISISLQDLCNNRFAVAGLYGKLANLFPDLPSSALTQTGLFKALTGGDALSTEKKFKDRFTFVNSCKLTFSCNELPRVTDDSDAFYRRWIIINFPRVFEGAQADKQLSEKLTTPQELSGILNWSMQGLYRLLERGDFSYSLSTAAIRDRYIRLSDPVKAFLLDRCIPDSQEYIRKAELYSAYAQYCRDSKCPVLQDNSFARRLPTVFSVRAEKKMLSGTRVPCWVGVRFRTEQDSEDDPGQALLETEG